MIYRQEAGRAHELAGQAMDAETRVQLLHIARVYGILAASAERSDARPAARRPIASAAAPRRPSREA